MKIDLKRARSSISVVPSLQTMEAVLRQLLDALREFNTDMKSGVETIAFSPDNNIWVAGSARVKVFNAGGTYQFDAARNKKLKTPRGIAFNHITKEAFITDTRDRRVVVCKTSDGVFLRKFGADAERSSQMDAPIGVAVDSVKGRVFVAQGDGNCVTVFARRDGMKLEALESVIGDFGAGIGQLSNPHGLCLTPEGYVVVADTGNKRIQVCGAFLFCVSFFL